MLMLPSGLAPDNLHLRPTVKAAFVESDVFDICHRLHAISPNLHLWQLEEAGVDYPAWVVTEDVYGVESLVKKYYALDARMIEDVQRMLHIPLEQRLVLAQAEIDKAEADEKQAKLDRMFEEVGPKMERQLWSDGFVEHRSKSFPKSPIKQRAGR